MRRHDALSRPEWEQRARVLNAAPPGFVRLRTFIPAPGTPWHDRWPSPVASEAPIEQYVCYQTPEGVFESLILRLWASCRLRLTAV